MMSVREAVKVLNDIDEDSFIENLLAMKVVLTTVEKVIDLVDKEEVKDE